MNIFTVNCRKDENKENRDLEWPNFLKIIATPVFSDFSVTVWTISVPKFRMLFEGPLGVGSIHSPDL